jgi:hypothetical protein
VRHAPRIDELRDTCAEIARRARSVRVHTEAIAPYAATLDLPGAPGAPSGSDDETPGSSRTERALYWLTLDAINFGSGWFPTLRKADGRSGYGTVAAAWRRRIATDGPLTVAELAGLDGATVARILGQDPDHELMALYAHSLRDLGARLDADWDGEVLAPVDAAGGSAVAFALELGSWACFADRSRYQELSVPFLKRAQIAAADLARAGVVSWHDTPRLTMFADNLVPHVLRLDGVLRFDPGLIARIDAGALIAHGSPEEVEIRACALHAVELLLAARGHDVSAATVDQRLWQRGQSPRYKAAPRHRSRCTAY